MDQIIAALIGGFLAAGTGWFLQVRPLEALRLKKLKRLLILGISDDLKSSIELYGRVIDEWEKSQTVWFTTLNELRESRQAYIKTGIGSSLSRMSRFDRNCSSITIVVPTTSVSLSSNNVGSTKYSQS